MDNRDIQLVQSSFAEVLPMAETAAALFYKRLFEIAPEVRPLFKSDMAQQGAKLMSTLSTVVSGLSNLSSVLPAASALAKRHVTYGVTQAHYGPVSAALLWTLEQGLGPKWTPELAEAWTKAYTTLSNYMIAEAYGTPAAAE